MRSRRLRLRGVAAWLAIVVMPPAPEALSQSARVVERVLAVVDRQIVFSSEVRLVQALRGVSAEAAREALIDELLMYQEAARLRRNAVSPDAVDSAFDGLRGRLPASIASDASALRRLARRQLVILKYIEFRFRPLIATTQQEVEAERARREGLTHEAARELIERRRLDERVEQWIADLRSGARIRYNDLDAPSDLKASQP